MKHIYVLMLVFGGVLLAQPAATPSPDTMVATFDGKKITASELQALLRALPPQYHENFSRSPKAFIEQIALMKKLGEIATQNGLDRQSPFKEQLEFQRLYILSTAQMTDQQSKILIGAEDAKKFYQANLDRYSQARVKVIYISYSSNPNPPTDSKGNKLLTEAEANAKAEKLRGELRAGADFVKLAKQHSEDVASLAKDAEFGTIRKSDKIPDNIRVAIFALKPGEVSEPVRAPNGYYLFRCEETSVVPYEQVQSELVQELRQTRFHEWMQAVQKSIRVTIEDEAFFKSLAPPPGPAPAK